MISYERLLLAYAVGFIMMSIIAIYAYYDLSKKIK